MLVDALIPVRALGASKARLDGLLSRREREQLAGAMLEDVLAAVRATPALRRVWIVTSDAAAAALAEAHGAAVLPEVAAAGASPLNAALEGARTAILARDDAPEALLVLPLDVPAISPATLTAFLRGLAAGGGPLVRICPSRRDGGTSGLLLRPPAIIPFRYGADSAAAHARAGSAAGATVTLRPLPLLQDDVDVPEDIERLLRGPCGERTRAVLREINRVPRSSQAGTDRQAELTSREDPPTPPAR